MSFNWKC